MVEEPRRRLGRGLAALLGDAGEESPAERPRGQRKVPIEFLRPNPRNPRSQFGETELADLASSIREKGIIQPIIVRAIPSVADAYEIIAGERRWRAAQAVGLTDVPVVLAEADDKEALELAIIENVQRADLNAIEEARGYERLAAEFGYAQGDIARNHRQEPLACRQHAAPSEFAGSRQSPGAGRADFGRPCARAPRPRQSRRGGASDRRGRDDGARCGSAGAGCGRRRFRGRRDRQKEQIRERRRYACARKNSSRRAGHDGRHSQSRRARRDSGSIRVRSINSTPSAGFSAPDARQKDRPMWWRRRRSRSRRWRRG